MVEFFIGEKARNDAKKERKGKKTPGAYMLVGGEKKNKLETRK